MNCKRGGTELTVRKLLVIVMLIIVLLLVLTLPGRTKELAERVGAKADEVLIMIRGFFGGGGESSGCDVRVVSDVGPGKNLLDAHKYLGLQDIKLEYELCSDGCYLRNSGVSNKWVIDEGKIYAVAPDGSREGVGILSGDSESAKFYYEFYNVGVKYFDEKNLAGEYQNIFNDVWIFYSQGDNIFDNSAVYIKGWDNHWTIYSMENENLVLIKDDIGTDEMLTYLLDLTDDVSDELVYLEKLTYQDSQNEKWVSFLNFEELSLISKTIKGYDSDNNLDGEEDIVILKSWIEKNAQSWNKVFLPGMGGNDFFSNPPIGDEIVVLGMKYSLEEVKEFEDLPIVIFSSPGRESFGFMVAPPLGLEKYPLRIVKEGFGGFERVGFDEDYKSSEYEFRQKYLATSIYEFLNYYC
ncbi:MAG: hypothetical protein ABIF88_00005 [archaeon]